MPVWDLLMFQSTPLRQLLEKAAEWPSHLFNSGSNSNEIRIGWRWLWLWATVLKVSSLTHHKSRWMFCFSIVLGSNCQVGRGTLETEPRLGVEFTFSRHLQLFPYNNCQKLSLKLVKGRPGLWKIFFDVWSKWIPTIFCSLFKSLKKFSWFYD